MGASCSSPSDKVLPPPRTRRQLTAYVSSLDEDSDEFPASANPPPGRLRSESLKEEDLKKHMAALLKESENASAPRSPSALLRQDSSKRVRFPKQDLFRVYEYVPDALLPGAK